MKKIESQIVHMPQAVPLKYSVTKDPQLLTLFENIAIQIAIFIEVYVSPLSNHF